jgi:hypothetical protein
MGYSNCGWHTGVRRILAVTAEKAEEAFEKAEALSQEVAALAAQDEPDEATVKALVDRIDRDDTLPTTSRSEMKSQVRLHCTASPFPQDEPHWSCHCFTWSSHRRIIICDQHRVLVFLYTSAQLSCGAVELLCEGQYIIANQKLSVLLLKHAVTEAGIAAPSVAE